ncbi:uncharacterized protein LOC133328779 [Musca vetustissima]|uniref:uncharacterized protein LOC133328779 n=1 Tax=Musca vetustissima TaxID=27455 RepID=UPI002AB70AE4|nr:uncharacterized protein LOC133328779 [Musca vetustissima]
MNQYRHNARDDASNYYVDNITAGKNRREQRTVLGGEKTYSKKIWSFKLEKLRKRPPEIQPQMKGILNCSDASLVSAFKVHDPSIAILGKLENSCKLGKTVRPATAKGESFSSVINRVRALYTTPLSENPCEITFLYKTTFENDGFLASVLEQYDVLNTEMQMYEKVLPQMQKSLWDIGDEDRLFARTLYVDYSKKTIFFEDLSVKHFVMANRLVGLDEEHMHLCLRKLAKFHASAAVLNEKLGGTLEIYQRGIFNRHVNAFGGFFEAVTKVCAEFCSTCPELGDYYTKKLLRLVPHLVENTTKCYDPKEGHFLTLNHGDIWTNNFMMQYAKEGKKLKDILLIDFQYCNWTSPAVDLHYLFNTSLADDLLFHKQDYLIKYYHEVLSTTLRKLKYKQHIPTLHELQIQLLQRGFLAVATLLANLPLLTNDQTEDADFECILLDNEKSRRFRKVLYENKRVQSVVMVMLPHFDRLGYLDMLD